MAMRLRRVAGWLATGVAIAAVFAFLLWALVATGTLKAISGSSTGILVVIAAGVLGTGALAGLLMWLAFYSDRKGFDDPPNIEEHQPPP
jgi:hypothetical protein